MAQSSTTQRRSRFWLFFPYIILLILIAAYSVYWTYARGLLERGIDDWIMAERANGAVIEYSDRKLDGFPFRFSLTLKDPVYQSSDQLRWEGEQLHLVMQPWNWNHVIGRAPGRNLITEPSGLRHTLNIDNTSAASLSWNQTHIKRVGLQLADVDALIDGQAISGKGFSLNLSPNPDAQDNMRIALQWDELTVPSAETPLHYLGQTLQPSRIIAEIEGFYPALLATEGDIETLPAVLARNGSAIHLGQALLNWGPLKFGAKGSMASINNAWAGELKIRLSEPEPLITAMTDAKVSREQIAAITALGAMSANDSFLALSINDNAITYLGQRVLELPVAPSSS